jgi:enamine deaminase RidA (YjgF/YER057c/UK114 family)
MNDMAANSVLPPSAAAAELPRPLGDYARWRRAGGLLFLAGVSARLPSGEIDGAKDGVKDVTIQTHRVLRNIGAILQEAGVTFADCVDMTCYLVRPEDFASFNAAYTDYFSAKVGHKSSPPARTTVVVHALPHPDMVVEIKAVACALASASGP